MGGAVRTFEKVVGYATGYTPVRSTIEKLKPEIPDPPKPPRAPTLDEIARQEDEEKYRARFGRASTILTGLGSDSSQSYQQYLGAAT